MAYTSKWWQAIALFPITYLEILLWLIMILPIKSFSFKIMGNIFGIYLGIITFKGETWLLLDSNNNITFVTNGSLFAYPLAFIVMGISLIQFTKLYAFFLQEMASTELNPNGKTAIQVLLENL